MHTRCGLITVNRFRFVVQELNDRVAELEAVLRRCVELAMTELSRRSAEYLDEVDACVRATETSVLGMRKIVKKYSRLPADNQHTETLKKLLNKVPLICPRKANFRERTLSVRVLVG